VHQAFTHRRARNAPDSLFLSLFSPFLS